MNGSVEPDIMYLGRDSHKSSFDTYKNVRSLLS